MSFSPTYVCYEENTRLEAWEKYSVLVSRVNPADAQDIVCPDKTEI